ncbi:MAG: N-acetylmannosamine-6-phosphate 2-epimerase [Prochloraceae cyanobacterium]
MKNPLDRFKNNLIVSVQAPVDSPLHEPTVIAAMAKAAVNRGAAAVRIDTPAHVKAVRAILPDIPIIGLWKQNIPGCEVYITPSFEAARAIASAGADIIAIDATIRPHPQENVTELIAKIHQKLDALVMADVDNIESAIAAAEAGADLLGTTLYGYTSATKNLCPPGYSLLKEMVERIEDIPIICEGGVGDPAMAKKALDLGAYAVVVGTAITGIDRKVADFKSVF